jgi:hypothetical protein
MFGDYAAVCTIASILEEHVAVIFRMHIVSTLKMGAVGSSNTSGHVM